nr:hypothetical protein [Candidatus Freyarchaeota archaeon]
MSKEEKNSDKFSISLFENGLHSLWRGIEIYDKYTKTNDNMLLKEAIMFLHHGVELLMKEILVRHSPYLIFEDLRKATKKQKEADKSGIGIFFLPSPPRTVAYEEAINRVDAFIKPQKLEEKLLTNLIQLNLFRNQLEHYAIEVDKDEITQLLAELRNPLLDFFEAQIGGIKQRQPFEVIHVWNAIEDSAKELAKKHERLEEEVFALVNRFNGQKVPGHVMNFDDKITLPKFNRILREYSFPELGFRADIFSEGENLRWIIEVKTGPKIDDAKLHKLAHYAKQLNAKVWLVASTEIPTKILTEAKKLGILVTGAKEWREVKRFIEL